MFKPLCASREVFLALRIVSEEERLKSYFQNLDKRKAIILLLLFVPLAVFSQYLKPDDIDIFLDNLDMINFTYLEDDPEWERYIEMGDRIIEDIEAGDIESFGLHLVEYLDYKVPKNLEKVFREIGWERNGQGKMYTIFFGAMLLEAGSESFLLIFDSSDLNIIGTNFEKIKDKLL
jgi:hypothetical protein